MNIHPGLHNQKVQEIFDTAPLLIHQVEDSTGSIKKPADFYQLGIFRNILVSFSIVSGTSDFTTPHQLQDEIKSYIVVRNVSQEMIQLESAEETTNGDPLSIYMSKIKEWAEKYDKDSIVFSQDEFDDIYDGSYSDALDLN